MPETSLPSPNARSWKLRPLQENDTEAFHNLINNPRGWHTLNFLFSASSREWTKAWVVSALAMQEAGQAYYFALLDKENKFSGCISLYPEDTLGNGTAGNLHYLTDYSCLKQNILAAVITHIIQWALTHTKITYLRAVVSDDNPVSEKILQQAGFKTVGADSKTSGGTRHKATLYETAEATLPQPAIRKQLLVAAVALVDTQHRILLARRPEGKTLAGLWEFPGGKAEPGEAPEATLIREVEEELGIDISRSCLAPFTFASHSYDTFDLLMPLYLCRSWKGTPQGREGQQLAWVPVEQLQDYPMPPADIPLIPFLQNFL